MPSFSQRGNRALNRCLAESNLGGYFGAYEPAYRNIFTLDCLTHVDALWVQQRAILYCRAYDKRTGGERIGGKAAEYSTRTP